MSETITVNQSALTPKTDAEYQLAIGAMLDEMARANVRMDRNQADIDRLKAETRVMLANLDNLLTA